MSINLFMDDIKGLYQSNNRGSLWGIDEILYVIFKCSKLLENQRTSTKDKAKDTKRRNDIITFAAEPLQFNLLCSLLLSKRGK